MNNNQTSEDKDLFPVDLIEISKNTLTLILGKVETKTVNLIF